MVTDSDPGGLKAIHRALPRAVAEGEVVVGWALVMDVAAPDGSRYLAHRCGGGVDGDDPPTHWTVIGMQSAALRLHEDDFAASSITRLGDEDDDEGACLMAHITSEEARAAVAALVADDPTFADYHVTDVVILAECIGPDAHVGIWGAHGGADGREVPTWRRIGLLDAAMTKARQEADEDDAEDED